VGAACLLDNVLGVAAPAKSGYNFTYAVVAANGINGNYEVAGNPITANSTGVRSFCSFADAVVRYQTGNLTPAACVVTVPALQ